MKKVRDFLLTYIDQTLHFRPSGSRFRSLIMLKSAVVARTAQSWIDYSDINPYSHDILVPSTLQQ